MATIGITGHRFLAERDKLAAGLEQVTARLEADHPGPWTVVSALAEGADRFVAHRLLARPGSTLVAVLPLPVAEYVADFDSEPSRQEFDDLLARAREVVVVAAQADRDRAYEEAGLAALDRSDVLIAVWDGQGAQGRGGTGGIVATARSRGLPVAWVHAGNRRPGTEEPTSLGAEQGTVTFERFPAPERND